MKKSFLRIAVSVCCLLLVFSMVACTGNNGTETTTAADTTAAAETSAVETTPDETTEAAQDETTAAEEVTTEAAETTPAASDIKRNPAAHGYASLADGKGYSKISDFTGVDLYFSVASVGDYPVFYGYSMEGYYNIYPKYFQEFADDGVTVKTDYLQLLKEACGTESYKVVDATIEGYLRKIAVLYYGAAYEEYWTYFCSILEDAQEYQQLYDAKGVAKITGYQQSDLYACNVAALSYAYYGYTMDQYYKWYSTQGYFTVDGVDYYAKLVTAMNGQAYAQVTDEIKGILQKISLAFWKSEDYWTYFTFVKTSVIPEGKYTTVTTDYFKILETECGHNQFVKVNDTIKEALKYLSSSFYGDAQYWDYWCYTTYEITKETKAEGAADYTTLVGKDGEYKTLEYKDSDLYVNLDVTFDYAFNYTSTGSYAYTMSQWYSYGGTYAGNFIKTETVEVAE